MELKTLKEELQDLIGGNKVKAAFSFLKQELNRDGDKYDMFVTISRSYEEIIEQKMTYIIDYNTSNVEMNRISKSLLSFIKTIKKSDINTIEKLNTTSTDTFIHKQVENQILIFTEYEKPEVQDFFNQLNFTNVQIKTADNLDNINFNEFDLIIFDNRDLPICREESDIEKLNNEKQKSIIQRVEQMKYVINNSSKFIIHYGHNLYWINHNRKRVQAANSQFSLYARIIEVLGFINTYKV